MLGRRGLRTLAVPNMATEEEAGISLRKGARWTIYLSHPFLQIFILCPLTVRGKALHLYILSRLRGKRPGMVDVPVILALRGAPGQPGLHGETLSLSDRGRKPV